MRKYEAIRTEIKKLSDEQRLYKPQRKESYIANSPEKATAGLTTYRAVQLTISNKYELKHLFQAYAILKGKERPVVKKFGLYGYMVNEKKVQEMVEKFRPVEELAQ